MITSPEKTIRLFIAVNPGEAVCNELTRVQQKLERALCGANLKIKWVAPDAMHLTLAFLGNVPAVRVEEISRELEGAVCRIPAFESALAMPGFFGSPRSPHVVWAGVENKNAFEELQGAVSTAMSLLGFEITGQKFHPHFTLGRVKFCHDSRALYAALEKAQLKPQPFQVASTELMQSTLRPEGAEHTALKSRSLCTASESSL